MADFSLYYPHLLKYEGGYASAEYAAKHDDSGGETYCGIARNYNLNWEGWKIIDEYKKVNGLPKWNTRINDKRLYELCRDHSKKAYWDKMKLDQVLNQSVAEMIGDYGFNSGIGLSVRTVQKIIYDDKKEEELKVLVTGSMSNSDIAVINSKNSLIIFTELQNRRIAMIQNSTKINIKNKDGLIARAKSFTFKK